MTSTCYGKTNSGLEGATAWSADDYTHTELVKNILIFRIIIIITIIIIIIITVKVSIKLKEMLNYGLTG